jgi:hypothetical protein
MRTARRPLAWLAAFLLTLVAAAPAAAQGRQRVYLFPDAVTIDPSKPEKAVGLLRGMCFDEKVRGAPGRGDRIRDFSDPSQVVIERVIDGKVVATQTWADVVAGKDTPWIKFRGASETGGVNVEFEATAPWAARLMGASYKVSLKEPVIAARAQEKAQLNGELKAVLEKTEKVRASADQRRAAQDRLFGDDSPVNLLVGAHAQREVYWKLSPALEAGTTQKTEDQLVGRLVDGVRSKDPEVQFLQAAALFGPFTGKDGAARLQFLKDRELDLTDSRVADDEGLVNSAEVLRKALSLYAKLAADHIRHGDEAKDATEVTALLTQARRGVELLLDWKKAKAPTPTEAGMRYALLAYDTPALEAAAGGDNGSVTLRAKGLTEALDVNDFRDNLAKAAATLEKSEDRASLIQALEELKDDPGDGDAHFRAVAAADQALAVLKLVDQASGAGTTFPLLKLVDWLSGTEEVSPADRAATRRLAAFHVLRAAEYAKAIRQKLPAGLNPIAGFLPARGWMQALSDSPKFGVPLRKSLRVPGNLDGKGLRKLAQAVADLEEETGAKFTLCLREDSPKRALMQYNGDQLLLAVDETVKTIGADELGKSLFTLLERAAAEINGQQGHIRVLVANTQKEKSIDEWKKKSRDKEFVGKHVILGACPTRDLKPFYDLSRELLTPVEQGGGGAASVVIANGNVELPEYVMAVQRLLKTPQEQRAEMAPIEMLRRSYRDSTEAVAIAALLPPAEQAEFLEKVFGKELVPYIQGQLKSKKSLDNFRIRIMNQRRLFNGTARRDAPPGAARPAA